MSDPNDTTVPPGKPDAISQLEQWNRKHYFFCISANGNYMPGDGVAVKLSAAGRTVTVCDEDMIRHEDDYYPTIGDLIIEAIRQWHADSAPKKYYVYFFCDDPVEGSWEISVTTWGDRTTFQAKVAAISESEALGKVSNFYPNSKIIRAYEIGG